MSKELFKSYLKKMGYSVDSDADIPTVLLAGATKEDLKKKFIEVKLLAQKVGYHHTISVKNLEVVNDQA